MSRSRRGGFASVLIGLFLLVVLGIVVFLMFKDNTIPEVSLTPKTAYTSPKQEFTLKVSDVDSGVQSVVVTVKKGDNISTVLNQVFSPAVKSQELKFSLADTGIKDGKLELEVVVNDSSYAGFGRGNKNIIKLPLTIDMTPPRFEVKTMPPYIRKGGTACAVYSVNKDTASTGVKVGDYFFEGFKQANGDYLVFFAFPYHMTPNEFSPQLIAEDLAGNIGKIPLAVNRINREFRKDNIPITDNFLDTKMPEFEQDIPGEMTNLERFLKVNSELRKANQDTIRALVSKTNPEPLWTGVFLRLPNAATRAGFADHRTYMYNNQKIDEQTHLGQDLASLAQSPIPAANNGIIVFVGSLGIYGHLVVIDHGCGLQTLYSHLNDYSVEVGQAVKKGDIIGRTGKTGMAAGDHLHFGVTVGGIEVMPLEWFDPHWIKDNIVDRVNSAGGSMQPITVLPDIYATPTAPPANSDKKATDKPDKKAKKATKKTTEKKNKKATN
ncbi:M23 family metallopeptidase [Desulfovibrio litoralis]|uniref:Peptidase family M23 n=1 Tax=Desulfovibrio litoralis DSM 11393 TaxID=1121455 RepID=A0A1M7S6Q8_9BACT|nr:M23 family metallopeptidase [Desulfovibrio litoralis]SHN54032.1 Peptidase family M23 [Desulfovibrio litoralis DSM 11393]